MEVIDLTRNIWVPDITSPADGQIILDTVMQRDKNIFTYLATTDHENNGDVIVTLKEPYLAYVTNILQDTIRFAWQFRPEESTDEDQVHTQAAVMLSNLFLVDPSYWQLILEKAFDPYPHREPQNPPRGITLEPSMVTLIEAPDGSKIDEGFHNQAVAQTLTAIVHEALHVLTWKGINSPSTALTPDSRGLVYQLIGADQQPHEVIELDEVMKEIVNYFIRRSYWNGIPDGIENVGVFKTMSYRENIGAFVKLLQRNAPGREHEILFKLARAMFVPTNVPELLEEYGIDPELLTVVLQNPNHPQLRPLPPRSLLTFLRSIEFGGVGG